MVVKKTKSVGFQLIKKIPPLGGIFFFFSVSWFRASYNDNWKHQLDAAR